jgi:hypothetical protein
MALTNKLTAIADAIRGKTGKTEEMTLDQMATEIAGIQAGGGQTIPFIIIEEMTSTASTKTAVDTANYIKTIGDAEVGRVKVGLLAVVAKEFPNENTVNNSLILFGGYFTGSGYNNLPSDVVRWRNGAYSYAPPTASSYDVVVNPGDEFYKILVSYDFAE